MALTAWQATIVDEQGNIAPGAQIEVAKEELGLPPAVVFADKEGATPLGSVFNAGPDGFAIFYAAGGLYRITASFGSLVKVWRDVPLGDLQAKDFADLNASSGSGGRVRLTEPTEITVGTGQDFETLREAWDHLCADIDTAGFDVTFRLTDGVHAGLSDHTGTGNKGYIGGGQVYIEGIDNGAIITDSDDSFSLQIVHNCIQIQNLELRSTKVGFGGCLAAAWSGIVLFGPGVKFGSCVSEHMHASSGGQINSLSQAYSIVGGASMHIGAFQGGQVRIMGSAVTLTGTPAFTQFAAASDGGVVDVRGTTFTGTATGKAFTIDPGGVLARDTDNLSDLPGNAEGELGVNARYDNIMGPDASEVSGSFTATATVVIPVPIGATRAFINIDGARCNTSTRRLQVRASSDGGSTYPNALSCVVNGVPNPEGGGDGLIDTGFTVANTISWSLHGVIDGLRDGGVRSAFNAFADDDSVIVAGQGFIIDVGRITHIKIGWNASGNFVATGTYRVVFI